MHFNISADNFGTKPVFFSPSFTDLLICAISLTLKHNWQTTVILIEFHELRYKYSWNYVAIHHDIGIAMERISINQFPALSI